MKGSPKSTVNRTTQTSMNGTPPQAATSPSTPSVVSVASLPKDKVILEDVGEDSDGGGWETVHRGKKTHYEPSRKRPVKRAPQRSLEENAAPVEQRFSSNLCSVDSSIVRNGPCHKGTVVQNGLEEVKTGKKDSLPSRVANVRPDVDDDVLAVPLDYNDIEQDCASASDVERDKAISAFIEQEESVSKQIEEWHEQAMAAAIAHEEVSVQL